MIFKKSTKKTVSKKPSPDAAFQPNPDEAFHGVLVHRHFKPLYANAALARMFEATSVAQVLEMPLLRAFVPPENWPRLEQEHQALLQGEAPRPNFRERFITLQGQEIWSVGTRRVVSWQQQPAVLVELFDITAQARIETRLLDNELRLRALLTMLPLPIAILRLDNGQILHVNRKTCLQLGANSATLLRGTLEPYIADIGALAHLRGLLDLMPEVKDVELPMRTAKGEDFTADVVATRLHYEGHDALLFAFTDISERKQAETTLRLQALTDELTGIANRRHFFAVGEQEVIRARRYMRPLTAIMFDIDHFKKVNDQHGHAVGDMVLKEIVRRAQDQLRTTDLLARIGGEEFITLLPETDMAGALLTAERLRAAVCTTPITTISGAVHTSISVGVVQLRSHESLDALLSRADQTLYQAKNQGRNRVISA